MPIAYMQFGPVSFGTGGSAVGEAAYQGRTALYDARLDKTYDFSDRDDLRYSEVLLPGGAPQEYADSAVLWNAAQDAELGSTRVDTARPAWTFVGSLPRELSMAERIEVARSFVMEQLVERFDVAAELHLHETAASDGLGNPHLHALVSSRELGPDGFGAKAVSLQQRGTLLELRDAFAAEQNLALEAAGIEARVEARALEAEQEMALEPAFEEADSEAGLELGLE